MESYINANIHHAAGGSLKINLRELLISGLFSDLVIRCGGKEFKVHKNILYLQSRYFHKLLGGKFREAAEDTTAIDLDDEPEVTNTVLFYLYNFVYSDACYRGEDHMLFTVKVYIAADKYDVPELRTMAADRLRKICKPTESLNDFVSTIRLIDSSSHPADRTLWNIIIPAIKNNMAYLLEKGVFRELVEDLPELKFDLLALFIPPTAKAEEEGARETIILSSRDGARGAGRRLGE